MSMSSKQYSITSQPLAVKTYYKSMTNGQNGLMNGKSLILSSLMLSFSDTLGETLINGILARSEDSVSFFRIISNVFHRDGANYSAPGKISII
jgi:hypothetical protein